MIGTIVGAVVVAMTGTLIRAVVVTMAGTLVGAGAVAMTGTLIRTVVVAMAGTLIRTVVVALAGTLIIARTLGRRRAFGGNELAVVGSAIIVIPPSVLGESRLYECSTDGSDSDDFEYTFHSSALFRGLLAFIL